MVRLPPATDLIDLVLSVVGDPGVRARGGSVVVLVPSTGWAERLVARLVRRGCPATSAWDEARAGWPVVVGSRAGAWAPVPRLAAAVVLDAHDASYREESAPTYSALDVLLERARRQAAPCVLASPVPPVALAALDGVRTVAPPAPRERAGWPALERVDRRGADPRSGMFSEEFVRLARAVLDDPAAVGTRGPLVCVYNRTGGARLLACSHCGELARCARCGAAAGRPRGRGGLALSPLRRDEAGRVCRLWTVAHEDVAGRREPACARSSRRCWGWWSARWPALAAAGPNRAVAGTPVLVGTEAVLHRVRHAAAVVFLDIDLHLLAPRLSATEDTLALFVRAARLVGARGTAAPWARVQAQTRVPDHPVLQAVARGEPAPVLADEVAIRRASALPPFAALALVSGTQAPGYAAALAGRPRPGRRPPGRSAPPSSPVVVSPLGEDRFLVRADTHAPLCDLLARVPRPPGRGLRIEVDPSSL